MSGGSGTWSSAHARANDACEVHARPHKRAERCGLFVSLGGFTHSDKPGTNSVHFAGWVGRRALTPGRYTLEVVAIAQGKTSLPVAAGFTILPR